MAKPDRLSRAILDFMAAKGAGVFCSISENWDSEADIPLSELCRAVKKEAASVVLAVSFLSEQGLVEYRSLKSRQGRVNVAFRLTHPGLRFREFHALTRRERWKERLFGFLSGVLVTVLSGLILSWLSR